MLLLRLSIFKGFGKLQLLSGGQQVTMDGGEDTFSNLKNAARRAE
jgi:hypothetical protein